LLVALAALSACDLIPGTSAGSEKQARQTVATLLIDPSPADFRNLTHTDESFVAR
jgi:hypothetical protein